MVVGADIQNIKDNVTYVIDSLRFALSLSPHSIPCDTSIGISMSKVSDFNEITRHQVTNLIGSLGFSNVLSCTQCSLNHDTITIIVKYSPLDKYYQFSLEQ